jgi:phosphatidylserine/phosphatidylglycerophosphate/cardiolipin synthase-like enzyme
VTAYLGGTCGLGHSGQVDLVLRTSNPKADDAIGQLIKNTYRKGSVSEALNGQDQETVLDSRTTLLLDSGTKGRSLIFERALELIDSSEEWLTMTCQYFPNATTAHHLEAARRRGVKVRLHYNHPSRHASATVLGHRLVLLRERARHNKELFSLQTQPTARRIHAKLIATEKGAIIGSHNYVTAGVKLGTAEAAILRLDLAFAKKTATTVEKALLK